MNPINQIVEGNCVDVLHTVLEPESVHCCVTSPAYYKMRSYQTPPQIWDDKPLCEHDWIEKKVKQHAGRGDAQKSGKYSEQPSIPDMIVVYAMCAKCQAYKGELGQEPTPDLYIKHLMLAIDGVYRVLRNDGTFYLNLADKYDDKGSLMGIPFRVATEMVNHGWFWRNTIIWYKRNVLPQPDKTKYTPDFEYIFFMSKRGPGEYFFDTQYQPYAESTIKEFQTDYHGKNTKDYKTFGAPEPSTIKSRMVSRRKMPPIGSKKYQDTVGKADNPKYSGNQPEWKSGSMKRCVWNVTTKSFKGAHKATFNEALIETPIKASCPELICNNCGFNSTKVYTEERRDTRPGLNVLTTDKSGTDLDPYKSLHRSDLSTKRQKIVRAEIGQTTCGCNAGWHSGVVLDPFMGAGTVALTALKLGRRFIGIELLHENVEMALARIKPYMKDNRLF